MKKSFFFLFSICVAGLISYYSAQEVAPDTIIYKNNIDFSEYNQGNQFDVVSLQPVTSDSQIALQPFNKSPITKKVTSPPVNSTEIVNDEPYSEQSVAETIETPKDIPSFYSGSENSQFLRINRKYIASRKIGDVLNLSVPQTGNTYPIKITNKEIDKEGNMFFDGGLENYNAMYRVEITQTATNTFISISTPEGNYVIEAENDLALIVPLSDIRHPRNIKDSIEVH